MKNKGSKLNFVRNVLVLLILLLSMQSIVSAAEYCPICVVQRIVLTETVSYANNGNGTHSIIKTYKCSNCGYDKVSKSTANHSAKSASSVECTSTFNPNQCSICGYFSVGGSQYGTMHNYVNGVCTRCKNANHTHDYSEYDGSVQPDASGHYMKCSTCGGRALASHIFQNASSVNCNVSFNPTECTECGFVGNGSTKSTGTKHNYVSGKCTRCGGASSGSGTHTHTYDTNHKCSCGDSATPSTHEYDINHLCKICGLKHKEGVAHKYRTSDHKCRICNVLPSIGTTHIYGTDHKCTYCGLLNAIGRDHKYGANHSCIVCGTRYSGGTTHIYNTVNICIICNYTNSSAGDLCNQCKKSNYREIPYSDGLYNGDMASHITKMLKCDSCGFDKVKETVPHKIYVESKDETYHYTQVCKCGLKAGEEKHDFDSNNKCKICSYQKRGSGGGPTTPDFTITERYLDKDSKQELAADKVTKVAEGNKYNGKAVEMCMKDSNGKKYVYVETPGYNSSEVVIEAVSKDTVIEHHYQQPKLEVQYRNAKAPYSLIADTKKHTFTKENEKMNYQSEEIEGYNYKGYVILEIFSEEELKKAKINEKNSIEISSSDFYTKGSEKANMLVIFLYESNATHGEKVELGSGDSENGKESERDIDFADIAGHWAENYIITLARKYIIDGYPDGRFLPEGTLSNGEFFKLIVAASVENFDTTTSSFHWAMPYAQVLIDYGILDNRDVSVEMLDKPIPRIEVVKILSECDIKIRKNDRKTSKLNFTDVDGISSYEERMLKHAVSKGIINGDPDGKFRPSDSLKRAEAAKIIYVYRGL